MLAGLFDTAEEGLRVFIDRHAGFRVVEGGLAEGEPCLDLLRDLLGSLLPRRACADSFGFTLALVVDEDPPCPFPLSNFNSHRSHLLCALAPNLSSDPSRWTELRHDTLYDLVQLVRWTGHAMGGHPGVELVTFHQEFPSNAVMRQWMNRIHQLVTQPAHRTGRVCR